VNLSLNFSAELWFLDIVASSAYHIPLPHGFLHWNLSFPKVFQLGTFLVWTDFEFCRVAIGGKAYFEFSAKLKFLML
jgi:hypothetical protein